MKKYLFILFIAIIAFSCNEDKPWADGQGPESDSNERIEQVESNAVQQTEVKEDKDNNKDKEESSSFFEHLFIFISLLLSIASFIMVLNLMRRNKVSSDSDIDFLKKEVATLRSRADNLDISIKSIKKGQSSSTGSSLNTQQPRMYGQSHRPLETVNPNDDKSKNTDEGKPKEEDQKPDKPSEAKLKKPTSKTLYLGINSQDCFPDTSVSESKTETSKFIATVITGGTVATFEVIDVERIRSVNTAQSVKQKGSVPIKDANGIKNQEPGKMHKVNDGNNSYWVIDEPVVVEFFK